MDVKTRAVIYLGAIVLIICLGLGWTASQNNRAQASPDYERRQTEALESIARSLREGCR